MYARDISRHETDDNFDGKTKSDDSTTLICVLFCLISGRQEGRIRLGDNKRSVPLMRRTARSWPVIRSLTGELIVILKTKMRNEIFTAEMTQSVLEFH
jgi:hypothetical protein